MPPCAPSFHTICDSMKSMLKQSGKPALLTVNGQDKKCLETVRAISRGLDQAKRGEGRPMRAFLEGLASEHGISLKCTDE